MLSIIKTIVLFGLEGCLIHVQVDVSKGVPRWEVVGLPDTSVRESKERVRIAIKNSGIEFPNKRIIVNLAPADTRKEGSIFDLPIAIGILVATGIIQCPNITDFIFIGELSLDGSIRKTDGILAMCMEAKKLGLKNIIIPKDNELEASIVQGINVLPAENILQVINHLNKIELIPQQKREISDLLISSANHIFDFSEVKGQESAKRALEIAASGGHNCIMIGSPGSGKTMLAQRLSSILPDLSFEESLEVTKIHSIAGILNKNNSIILERPFRSPHHSISSASLIGGGKVPKPGEISLAHYGVLFLDELTEFNKHTLEVLRGPLEDGQVTISRVNATLTYPCQFILVASMNPCPCGYFGSYEKECNCTPQQVSKYIGKISGPLLDRIDINVSVSSVKYSELDSSELPKSSIRIKERVNSARQLQRERYKEYGIFSNSELTPKLISKFCKLDKNAKLILKNAFEKMGLSARGHGRLLKVSRTIADLDNSAIIQGKHIAEAIQYRKLDRQYWKGV